MKKLLLMGTFALFCTTLFSCTADDFESNKKDKTVNEIKKDSLSEPSYATGPDDDPIVVPPPKK
ncbi:hypothetical protein [uncultured Flavobacterium sp.]|uniref:hypothetical protein n=1 Tax=uncultured Flavobacterium sp. TaxID=165435 RepID=UPI00292F6D79|nr:hypothetical protein [uncultured Flavobacterium sp.]